jgi:AcrR family transcriptional regulator
LHHFASKDVLYGEVFERLLSDWFERLTGAFLAPDRGIDKVELVIRAGFDFFADNPDYVRLVRREALDGGAHLGIDLAAVLRPQWDRAVAYFQREMDAGVFRRHDPEQLLMTGYGALLSYFSDSPFLGGLLDVDPLDPAALTKRRDHVTAFFRMALQQTAS